MILNPLQRIEITESNKKFRPGSRGYFVAQDKRGAYNQWDMQIVFTRFGKKGRPRVEPAIALTRIVEYDKFTNDEQVIMRIVGPVHKLDPALMDKRGKRHNPNENAKLKTIPMETKDVLYLPDKEFMAYITALSLFIDKIVMQKRVRGVTRLYYNDAHFNGALFERHNFNLDMASPESLGRHLLHGIRYDDAVARGRRRSRTDIRFSEAYKNQTDTLDKKRNLLNSLRLYLCMSRNSLASYKKQVKRNFSSTEDTVNRVIAYYKKAGHKGELMRLKEQLED